MFRRMHCLPSICGFTTGRNPKEKYKYQKSVERYERTADGQYMKSVGIGLCLQGEIGVYEGMRFITS